MSFSLISEIAWTRSCLSFIKYALVMFSEKVSSTDLSNSSSMIFGSYSKGSFPISLAISFIASITSCIS